MRNKYITPVMSVHELGFEGHLLSESSVQDKKLDMDWYDGKKGTDANVDFEVLTKRWHDEDEWN